MGTAFRRGTRSARHGAVCPAPTGPRRTGGSRQSQGRYDSKPTTPVRHGAAGGTDFGGLGRPAVPSRATPADFLPAQPRKAARSATPAFFSAGAGGPKMSLLASERPTLTATTSARKEAARPPPAIATAGSGCGGGRGAGGTTATATGGSRRPRAAGGDGEAAKAHSRASAKVSPSRGILGGRVGTGRSETTGGASVNAAAAASAVVSPTKGQKANAAGLPADAKASKSRRIFRRPAFQTGR